MRNLKKILALVLALVMSMSLVVTANAFSDDDAIAETYREAATVLDGLKVLQGRDDGNFDPKASITRAEMAAIVYRIMTTDVEDKQTSIYAESSKLYDLDGAKWAAGYVGFCNNSQLIMGYPDGTFQPLKNVTGHEALAMLLRAIGYGKNGEFVGKDWAINTAIYAKTNGLLKNINESTLSQPATREMVAEMAFRALLAEKVNWSLGLNYRPNGETLGDAFGLVEFNGVVVANEYADLDAARPLAAGKTQIGEETYSYASLLTDIGESRHGWACGTAKNVIFIEDAGNTVYENAGAAADISTAAKFAKVTELARGAAEEFENFDSVDEGTYTALIRISYWTDTNDNGTVDAGETDVFPLDKKLSADDRTTLKGIFADDAKMDGWVVIGTNDLEEANDISNEMTWREFETKYLEDSSKDGQIDGVVNGEWLKVVDNDQDGATDYVFKTTFTVDCVEDIDKKGNITYTTLDPDDYRKVVAPEDLAEGDVILWTAIDGVVYVTVAESFEAEVKKYSWKTDEITTEDDEVYGQSGIYNSDDANVLPIETDLEEILDGTGYALYKDHFGFIAAYNEIEVTNLLKLLTDGYYSYGYNKKDVYRVEYWDNEAQDFARANVNTKTSWLTDANKDDTFIDSDKNTGALSEGWERLIGAVGTGNAEAWTNVAAVNVADEVATIKHVDSKSNKSVTDIYELKNTADFTAKDQMLDMAAGTDKVLTNSKTVFYYVYFDGNKTMTVTEKVGYQNSLKVEADNGNIHAAYAAATTTHAYVNGDTYPVADVVVVEMNSPLKGASKLGLLFSIDEKRSGEVRALNTILGTAPSENTEFVLDDNWTKDQYEDLGVFNFYTIVGKDNKATDAILVEDYYDNGIYADTIDGTSAILDDSEFQYVVLDGRDDTLIIPLETPVITFSANRNGTFDAHFDDEITVSDKGDKILWVENADGKVLYIINVSESLQAKNDIIDELETLWTNVNADGPAEELNIDAIATKIGALTADSALTPDEIETAQDLLEQIENQLANPAVGIAAKNQLRDWKNWINTLLPDAIALRDARTAALTLLPEVIDDCIDYVIDTFGMDGGNETINVTAADKNAIKAELEPNAVPTWEAAINAAANKAAVEALLKADNTANNYGMKATGSLLSGNNSCIYENVQWAAGQVAADNTNDTNDAASDEAKKLPGAIISKPNFNADKTKATITISGSGKTNLNTTNGWSTTDSNATFKNANATKGITVATIDMMGILKAAGFNDTHEFKIVQVNEALKNTYWTVSDSVGGRDGTNGTKTSDGYNFDNGRMDDDGNGNFAFLIVDGKTVSFQISARLINTGDYGDEGTITITVDTSGYTVTP